jgi:hypothetical protein
MSENWKEKIQILLKTRNSYQTLPFNSLVESRIRYLVKSLQSCQSDLKSKVHSLERESIIIRKSSG